MWIVVVLVGGVYGIVGMIGYSVMWGLVLVGLIVVMIVCVVIFVVVCVLIYDCGVVVVVGLGMFGMFVLIFGVGLGGFVVV